MILPLRQGRLNIDPICTTAHLVSSCSHEIAWPDHLTHHVRLDSRHFQTYAVYQPPMQQRSKRSVSRDMFSKSLSTLNPPFPVGTEPMKHLINMAHGIVLLQHSQQKACLSPTTRTLAKILALFEVLESPHEPDAARVPCTR